MYDKIHYKKKKKRILEWDAISPPGDLPDPGIKSASLTFSALAGGILYHCVTWELQTHHLYLSDNTFLIIIVN